MKSIRITSLLAACSIFMLAAPAANAESIAFVTTGTFSISGSSQILTGAGLDITFDSGTGLIDLNDGEFSNVSFGQFNTSNTSALTDQPVVTDFTLDIGQFLPNPDSYSFLGAITGTLSIFKSTMVIQLSGPLSFTTMDGRVKYEILNADGGTPGRIFIGSPQTNNGLTSINGRITLIPEPSAFALLGLGVPAVLLLHRRRRAAA
jgi:hypothetical protein